MTEDFGAYHPGAARHRPYWDNMAAWRNQVASETSVSGYADPPYVPESPPQTREEIVDEAYRETQEQTSGEVYHFAEDGTVSVEEPDGSEWPVEPSLTEVDRRLLDQLQETLERYQGEQEGHPSPPVEEEELFDPSEHTAPVVLEHLKGAARTEVIRVLTAEKGGKARKGILKLEPELLAQASE